MARVLDTVPVLYTPGPNDVSSRGLVTGQSLGQFLCIYILYECMFQHMYIFTIYLLILYVCFLTYIICMMNNSPLVQYTRQIPAVVWS